MSNDLDAGQTLHFPRERVVQARGFFHRHGITIAAWAKREGYNTQLVRHVAAGRKQCLYGKTHEIAVKIGLKDDPNATASVASHG